MLALSMKVDVGVYVTASEAELAKRRGGEVDHEFLGDNLNSMIRVPNSWEHIKSIQQGEALKRR